MTRHSCGYGDAMKAVRCRRNVSPWRIGFAMVVVTAVVGGIFPVAKADTAIPTEPSSAKLPNVVFILMDDLGYGDVGCYGQKKIRTPNIDRLAEDGIRFTSHYAGNNVCAPSRCVLMTGLHPGHTFIRDNRQATPDGEGQYPVPDGMLTFPRTLQGLGYTLGCFGKWGLGPVGSSGDPLRQGFSHFFGYNCQAVAHNYYPTSLWNNDTPFPLNNRTFSPYQKLPPGTDPYDPAIYTPYTDQEYAPDRIAEQTLEFIRENRGRPFAVFCMTTIPHLALQVPEDSLAEYRDQFDDVPYTGDRGYLPNRYPRATYAAMVTRFDREIGRMINLIGELGLTEETIFIFTSDNGPLYDRLGGTDTDFFDSGNGFRGRKGSMYEGGLRVPCIVQWKGRIATGRVTDRVTGSEDWFPTILELIGRTDAVPRDVPTDADGGQAAEIDGISFAKTLLSEAERDKMVNDDQIVKDSEYRDPLPERAFLYRESPGYGGQVMVRSGPWKLVRQNLLRKRNGVADPGSWELYHLGDDPGETRNLLGAGAANETPESASPSPEMVQHLEKAEELRAIIRREHTPSTLFPMDPFVW